MKRLGRAVFLPVKPGNDVGEVSVERHCEAASSIGVCPVYDAANRTRDRRAGRNGNTKLLGLWDQKRGSRMRGKICGRNHVHQVRRVFIRRFLVRDAPAIPFFQLPHKFHHRTGLIRAQYHCAFAWLNAAATTAEATAKHLR